MFKQMFSLKIYFPNTSVVSEEGFNTQQSDLSLLEKRKNAIDQDKVFGPLLTNFSKAFGCLNHELLIAKLNSYGFTLPALKLIHNYYFNS